MESFSAYSAHIVDSVDEGVVVVDQQGNITLMNPAAESITCRSRSFSHGKSFASQFANEPMLLEMVAKTSETGMTVSDYEHTVLHALGQLKPVSATTTPLFDDNGNRIGTILILRDLTNIRDLERAVRHQDRLSSLGTLAAGLAHEIKNPLGGIKGAAQLMVMELPEESDLQENLRVIIKEAERVNRIVEELLQLGSPSQSKRAPVTLHLLLADIILLLKGVALDQGVTLTQHVDPSIPPILADGEQLTQLFLNLIKNAVEASPKGGRVTVSNRILSDYTLTQRGEKRSRMVAFEVTDTGTGIEPEVMEKLFTPFYSTKPKGTGLGLAICQKIVTEHRGMIKVDSLPGKGTQFTVMLPLVQ